MKFKQYLDEKVVLPSTFKINKLTKEIFNYIKTRDTDDLYDILDDMNRIGERYDVSFEYGSGKTDNEDYFGLEGGEYFDRVNNITITIVRDDFEKTFTNDNLLEKFIAGLRSILSHEMVHQGQASKYNPKYKIDIKKQVKELQNLVKKHDNDEMLAYLNRKEEIMAWANTMLQELLNLGHKKEEILTMLKNTESNKEELEKSYAFDAMYRILRQFYPKNWNRFLKQVVGYINEL